MTKQIAAFKIWMRNYLSIAMDLDEYKSGHPSRTRVVHRQRHDRPTAHPSGFIMPVRVLNINMNILWS